MSDARIDAEALRTSDARFRLAVETLGEGVVITDADDVVVYANSRMVELSGYAREEMIGQKVSRLLVPEEDQGAYAQRMDIRMQGVAEQYEVSFRRKDGRRFWAEVNGSPLRDAADWLERYRRLWDDSFDRLDSYLRQLQDREQDHGDSSSGG